MARKIIGLNESDLIKKYLAGQSEKALAQENSVARSTIRRILNEHGVSARNRSEAMYERMKQATPEERNALTKAAHAAARGSKHSREHREAIASTRQQKKIGSTPVEDLIADTLREQGLEVGQQTAIGRYTCDLTTGPVAVEIFGGRWHYSGRHLARAQERFRHLLDEGWHVLIILITAEFPLTDAATNYVVSYLKETSSNPAMVRQYRVIGGQGELLTSASAETNHLPVEYPRRRTRDSKGRYGGTPR